MKSKRDQIAASLSNKAYRDAFVAEHITRGIAFQIRAMRTTRGWTQRQLSRKIGIAAQAEISRLERPTNLPNVRTLLKLASGFDVALVVRFAPFSQLADYAASVNTETLSPPSYSEDAALQTTVTVQPSEAIPQEPTWRDYPLAALATLDTTSVVGLGNVFVDVGLARAQLGKLAAKTRLSLVG